MTDLHKQSVNAGALFDWLCHLLLCLLGDLTGEAHLVQRQLVLPGRALHDCRQEGLGVEEAREPHREGQVEVVGPSLPAW